jgi:hypothetical protein
MLTPRNGIFVSILLFLAIAILSCGNIVFANSPPDMPPYCQETGDHKGCSYNAAIRIDLGEYADQLVAILDYSSVAPGSYCDGNNILQREGKEFSWPIIMSGSDLYLMRRDYFEKMGGIAGLFEDREEYPCGITEAVTYKYQKNPAEFAENAVRVLIPKEDENVWNHGGYGDKIDLKPWNKLFFQAPSRVSQWHEVDLLPDTTEEKRYLYRPAGYLCEGSFCQLVIYQSKEEQVFDNGTTKTISYEPPKFSGLLAALPTGPVSVSPSSLDIAVQFSNDTDYRTSFVFDLTPYKDDLVLVFESSVVFPNTTNSYEVVEENQFKFGQGYSEYLVIRKDYFDNNGGINGLFPLQKAEKDVYGIERRVWGPKDEEELRRHSFVFLVPSTEEEQAFWTCDKIGEYYEKARIDAEYGASLPVIGGIFGVLDPSREICSLREDSSVAPEVEDIKYFYRPSGFFCDDSLCGIVMYREKEERTKIGDFVYKDIVEWSRSFVETIQFKTPEKLSNVNASLPAPVAATTVEIPASSSAETSLIPKLIIQTRLWWANIKRFLISIFGVHY